MAMRISLLGTSLAYNLPSPPPVITVVEGAAEIATCVERDYSLVGWYRQMH